jgi:hypothetical protein
VEEGQLSTGYRRGERRRQYPTPTSPYLGEGWGISASLRVYFSDSEISESFLHLLECISQTLR